MKKGKNPRKRLKKFTTKINGLQKKGKKKSAIKSRENSENGKNKSPRFFFNVKKKYQNM